MTLQRPKDLSDDHWASIELHEKRLDAAVERGDRGHIIGAAKELCESVAAVICAEMAQTVSTGDDFGRLISTAHEALDRRPGYGAATEESIRLMSQSARTIVIHLNSLRNEFGTGHGRRILPPVTREAAAIAEQAARLWTSWSLGRLDEALRGEVATLIRELESGHWHRGLLTERLAEVDLRLLHSQDQNRIGVAVAQRGASGGTFVVFEAGVEPLRDGADAWPTAYRSGVAAGLLLDSDGRLVLGAGTVEILAKLVELMDAQEWTELASRARDAQWSPRLSGDAERVQSVIDKMESFADELEGARRGAWNDLTSSVRQQRAAANVNG